MDVIRVLQLDLGGRRRRRDVIAVAAACGVPYHTLRKIVTGETKDPGHLTVEKIRAYYEAVKPARAARRMHRTAGALA